LEATRELLFNVPYNPDVSAIAFKAQYSFTVQCGKEAPAVRAIKFQRMAAPAPATGGFDLSVSEVVS
jgi:hypothetical protein